MEKEQCAILLAMTILIAVATIGLVVTLVQANAEPITPANTTHVPLLPKQLIINGPSLEWNATSAEENNRTAENLLAAIESWDG